MGDEKAIVASTTNTREDTPVPAIEIYICISSITSFRIIIGHVSTYYSFTFQLRCVQWLKCRISIENWSLVFSADIV